MKVVTAELHRSVLTDCLLTTSFPMASVVTILASTNARLGIALDFALAVAGNPVDPILNLFEVITNRLWGPVLGRRQLGMQVSHVISDQVVLRD